MLVGRVVSDCAYVRRLAYLASCSVVRAGVAGEREEAGGVRKGVSFLPVLASSAASAVRILTRSGRSAPGTLRELLLAAAAAGGAAAVLSVVVGGMLVGSSVTGTLEAVVVVGSVAGAAVAGAAVSMVAFGYACTDEDL